MNNETRNAGMRGERLDVLRVLDQSEAALVIAGLSPDSIFPRELREARAAVVSLIDSHARLLSLCQSCGLPKTADDLAPLAEARRIIARLTPPDNAADAEVVK